MHAKLFYTDTNDRSSVIFVGSNMEKADIRKSISFIWHVCFTQWFLAKVLLFAGRQSGTECFGDVSVRGAQNELDIRGSSEKVRNEPSTEHMEFNRVVIKDGEVVRATGS